MLSYPTLSFNLDKTLTLIKQTAHQFAQQEIAPRAADID